MSNAMLQQRLHPMRVRVLIQHALPAASRNCRALVSVRQVVANLRLQVINVAVNRDILSRSEQCAEFRTVVHQRKCATGGGFERTLIASLGQLRMVDVEDNLRSAIASCHPLGRQQVSDPERNL